MNYLIFSDETGHWSDQKNYVRSWLIISEEEYIRLKNKLNILRGQNGRKKEFKYSPGSDYALFSNLNFDVYFTVTFCDYFKERNFDLISHLNSQREELFTFNKKSIKKKIINTVRGSIFLNLYEFFHLNNLRKFLNEKYPQDSFYLFIDSPQYQNQEWVEIYREVGLSWNYKIVNDSENYEGIQFADILAGTMNNILKKLSKKKEFNKFERFLFTKFSQQNGKEKQFLNNPNIIFWDEKYESLVNEINDFIREFKKNE